MNNTVKDYQDDTIDVFALINPLIAGRKFIIVFSFLAALIASVMLVFQKNSFEAHVRLFIGKSADPMSNVNAGAFGSSRESSNAFENDFGLDPFRFYREILKSRPFIYSVVELPVGVERGEKNVYEFTGIDPAGPMSKEEIYQTVSGMLSAEMDKTSGILTIGVKTGDRHFSMNFANIITSELEKFSLEFFLKRSRTKRLYLENRTRESEIKLKQVEERLKQFRLSNRRIDDSPVLQMEEQKIKRETTLEQDIYMSFARELEKIKLDEKREITPLIVLEPATFPYYKSGMAKRKAVMIAFFAAFIFSCFLTYIREFFRKVEKENSGEYRKFKDNMNSLSEEASRLPVIGKLISKL